MDTLKEWLEVEAFPGSKSYVRAYEERFEPQYRPLRPVVVRSVEQFLA